MLKKVLYVLGGFILLSLIVNLCRDDSKQTSSTSTTGTSPSAVASSTEEEKSNYTYFEKTDEMTDAKIKFASITSNNTVELDPPFGDCTMTYTIRRGAQNVDDVYLSISSGLFAGHQITGDNYVVVRFDSLPAAKYFYVEPSDGSLDAVFLKNTKDFIAKAKKATEVKIEVTLYDAGNRLFRFNSPQPLRWE